MDEHYEVEAVDIDLHGWIGAEEVVTATLSMKGWTCETRWVQEVLNRDYSAERGIEELTGYVVNPIMGIAEMWCANNPWVIRETHSRLVPQGTDEGLEY